MPLLATGEGIEENVPARILGHPAFLSSQISTAETKGTASNASSAYVYSVNPDAGPAVSRARTPRSNSTARDCSISTRARYAASCAPT